MSTINPEECGREDAMTAIIEGADPSDLCRSGQLGADEGLIAALGRAWVLEAAGAPDDSDESWETHGLPWCRRYAAAYAELAADEAAARAQT
jgi:hypothetical protein